MYKPEEKRQRRLVGNKVTLFVYGVFCLCVLFCASADAVFIQGTSVATEITADDIGTVPDYRLKTSGRTAAARFGTIAT